MPDQLALQYGEEFTLAEDADELRAVVAQVVDAVGRTRVARDLGIGLADLSHALNGRDRHPIKAHWLAYLVRHDESRLLLRYLCELGGCELRELPTLTDADRVRLYEAELERRYTPEEQRRFVESALGGKRKGPKRRNA